MELPAIPIMDVNFALVPTLCVGTVFGALYVLRQIQIKARFKGTKFTT